MRREVAFLELVSALGKEGQDIPAISAQYDGGDPHLLGLAYDEPHSPRVR